MMEYNFLADLLEKFQACAPFVQVIILLTLLGALASLTVLPLYLIIRYQIACDRLKYRDLQDNPEDPSYGYVLHRLMPGPDIISPSKKAEPEKEETKQTTANQDHYKLH